MICPYCGLKMREEKGVSAAFTTSFCDGWGEWSHDKIILSALDNKLRTRNEDVAKELEAKGYLVEFDDRGSYYVIAEKSHQTAVEMPREAQDTFAVGMRFWDLGQRKEAIKTWEWNVERFPNHRDSWYNLGLAYGREDQFDRAVACLTRVVEIEPSDGQAWWFLGYSYRLLGDTANSARCYTRAKELGWNQAPL